VPLDGSAGAAQVRAPARLKVIKHQLYPESDAVICQEPILDLLSAIEDALSYTCPWKFLSMCRPSSNL
jgi:hypothetical protein